MKRILIIFIVLVSLNLLWSKVPKLNSRITDNANLLTSNQERELETYLKNVEDKTSAQIALLTVNSTGGVPIEEYSIEVVDKWQLGQRGRDNGILLLVSKNDRKVRLEVGYGLEDILTDLKSGYIVREVIIKEFKKGDYYSGIKDGLTKVGGLISYEYVISDKELAKYQNKVKKQKTTHLPIGLIIFILMIFSSMFRGRGRRRGGSGIIPFLLLSSLSSGSRSSGGGGFGSGGFGGFSGGGGGFGGGGASGGW